MHCLLQPAESVLKIVFEVKATLPAKLPDKLKRHSNRLEAFETAMSHGSKKEPSGGSGSSRSKTDRGSPPKNDSAERAAQQ
eukprot:4502-Rhodomonas_salina.4